MASLVQPAIDAGAFGVFTLATGLAMKLPVVPTAESATQETITFRMNRQVVTGPVPVQLAELAGDVGSFWYNHKTGEVLEYLALRGTHVVEGNMIDGFEVNLSDGACVPTSTWITAPEFALYLEGNGCATSNSVPARQLGAWVHMSDQGIDRIALPQSDSFAIITMLNMLSIAFYLIITVGSFAAQGQEDPTAENFERLLSKITRTVAIVAGVAVVYVSAYDVMRDTRCTEAEAAIAAAPVVLFLIAVANGLRLTSSPTFRILNSRLIIFSSASLALSLLTVDFLNTREPYSFVCTVVATIAVMIVLLVLSRPKPIITKYERAIVEIAMVSTLRVLAHHEMGELFALGTAGTVAIIVAKYCLPDT